LLIILFNIYIDANVVLCADDKEDKRRAKEVKVIEEQEIVVEVSDKHIYK
jgi:hypothetical protein